MPIERWTVGHVTISKVVEFERWVPIELLGEMLPKASTAEIEAMRWLRPHHLRDGEVCIGFYSFLIETPDSKLVVDTGVGNSKRRTAQHHNMLDTAYLQNFQQIWPCDDVDAVICTHLHVDHVGWNTHLVGGEWVPTFGNATHYFVKQEYEHWKTYAERGGNAIGYTVLDGRAVFEDSVQPIVDAGLATFIGPAERITSEVSVFPSHGHTPGHVSVFIESRGESAVITGDLMHSPCQIGHPDWSAIYDADPDAAAATRAAFLERFADTPTVVIGTHFGTPTGGRVHREGSGFRLSPAE